MISLLLWLSLFILLSVVIALFGLRFWFSQRRSRDGILTLAFFHPYCNDGGGGERVLWEGIRSLLEESEWRREGKKRRICLFTGVQDKDLDIVGDETKEKLLAVDILSKTKERFNIEIPSNQIDFFFLKKRKWIEASTWPRFTLLGQSLGSIVLGWEALCLLNPDVFVDTMGYAFTLPIFSWIAKSRVGCYVHYPTISSDMLKRVENKVEAHNNNASISRNPIKSFLKLYYYRAFAWLYGIVGSFSDLVMTNSSWTMNHISNLWKVNGRLYRLYPPCNTDKLETIPLNSSKRERIILSIAQFRPEKNHSLQLQSLQTLFKQHPEYKKEGIKLVMIGSSRNKEDDQRIEKLRQEAQQLGISENVNFVINAKFEELVGWYSRAMIGLHTMTDEHFGIGVVELMVAGVIPVAHNSAGPKLDIVIPFKGEKTGYLAQTAEEYASSFHSILVMDSSQREAIQVAGRKSASRFSDLLFGKKFYFHRFNYS
eukprot:TRINITY_DN5009_c0_g1_i1.p1 TRINITY_DN5009_c0_g1~~TRINITY_DN5009_c0_g1_i1.p1  ORF type:complete len:484 (-),score=164.67 TRINITY_DN5009_c0_g1_i1:78-1529(-)